MAVEARVAILVGTKGRGSNMAALISACQNGQVPANVALVVSPVATSPATELARSLGIEVSIASPKDPSYSENLIDLMRSNGVEWICLAGLLTMLPPPFVEAFRGRVLNVHPSLLPKFGGKGMYGMHVHEAVIGSGDTESGCTVHLVTEAYDEGPILMQKRCPVLPGDTPELLAARIIELEHSAFPEALQLVIERNAANI